VENAAILAAIIGGLGTVAFWLIRIWAAEWKTRTAAQDRRLDIHDHRHAEHDLNHAVHQANLEHVRGTVDEIHKDVKKILSGNISGKVG
jgi:hypothetical protein